MSVRGTLHIYSCPPALCPHVEWALAHELGTAVTLVFSLFLFIDYLAMLDFQPEKGASRPDPVLTGLEYRAEKDKERAGPAVE